MNYFLISTFCININNMHKNYLIDSRSCLFDFIPFLFIYFLSIWTINLFCLFSGDPDGSGDLKNCGRPESPSTKKRRTGNTPNQVLNLKVFFITKKVCICIILVWIRYHQWCSGAGTPFRHCFSGISFPFPWVIFLKKK